MDATTTVIETLETITLGYEDLTTERGGIAEIDPGIGTITAVMTETGITNDGIAVTATATMTTDLALLPLPVRLRPLLHLLQSPLPPHQPLRPSRPAPLLCPTLRT